MGIPVALVMCGTSLVTSNMVAGKLKVEAKQRKQLLELKIGKIDEVEKLINIHNPDVIIATSLGKELKNQKVFSGVPIISTIGEMKLYRELFAYLDKLKTIED